MSSHNCEKALASELHKALADKFAKYPDVVVSASGSMIRLSRKAPTPFEAYLDCDGSEYTLGVDEWHQPFDTAEEALNCLAFALSSLARFRIDWCGNIPVKWSLESISDGKWKVVYELGILLFPFWRKRATTYKQIGLWNG